MDCSRPGFPVLHHLLEFAQVHIHELVMPSNHLILCHPLLLLPSIFLIFIHLFRTSQIVLVVKNLSDNAGDIRDKGSIPGLGRSTGEGNGNPPQYSCWENPMGRGAGWAKAHRIAKSQTQLKWLSTHSFIWLHQVLVVAQGILLRHVGSFTAVSRFL